MFDNSHISVPIEDGDEFPIGSILNHTACPICGARLYWEPSIEYNEQYNMDYLVLKSSCCGKDFVAKQVFDEDGRIEDNAIITV